MKTLFQAASSKLKYQIFVTQESENKYDVIAYISGKEVVREEVLSKEKAIDMVNESIATCESDLRIKLKVLQNDLGL
jgi:hypothetical protein